MDTLSIKLSYSSGPSLILGPGQEMDITKITGLESSEYSVGLTDLAVVDGASMDGRHVKPRPIHIEGSFRSLSNMAEKREQLVRFFDPKHTGTLEASIGTKARSIDFELEGWTLKSQRNLSARVGFIADLICPNPYFYSDEWHPDDYGNVLNAGDVETGWRATITGPAVNPTVKDDTRGLYMRVIHTLAAGDTMVISTEDRRQTITLNGESAFRLIDRTSTPFRLRVGPNHISMADDNGAITPEGFSFRERFFGI